MINHFRTLLVNIAVDRDSLVPVKGEEYIDPSFSPVPLTGKLKEAQNTLVPLAASRADKNFYAYALMRFVHAPDFEIYTTTFDRRLVYDIDQSIYMSTDTTRTLYPQFSTVQLYTSLSAVLFKPGASVFDSAQAYKSDMDVFKEVWHGNTPCKDKVTAGILATVYAIEEVRTSGN